MKNVKCPNCGFSCRNHVKSNEGYQRWICKLCKYSFTNIITKDEVELQIFLKWLFGKNTQNEMLRQGRSSCRKQQDFGRYVHCSPRLKYRVQLFLLMEYI